MTLAASIARPMAKLKTPKAVPRRSDRGRIRNECRKQPLREPHVKSPEGDTCQHRPDARAEGKDHVGNDQDGRAGCEDTHSAGTISNYTRRIG